MKNKLFKIILTIFVLLSLCISTKHSYAETNAKNIYAFIKSEDLRQFNMVIAGFLHSFPKASIAIFNLEGKKTETGVADFIRAKKPTVIICFGSLAANLTSLVETEIPIIFTMVINYKRYLVLRQNNVTGVSMEIPPAKLFKQFKKLIPTIKSIGVPFHPSASAEIVQDALQASKQMGINLVSIKVIDPNDIKAQLFKYMDKYNGLWMLADTKLYNDETNAFQELLTFAKTHQRPLMVFSEAFLRPGALFSISIDQQSLGSQIARIAKKIVKDKVPPAKIPVAPPLKIYKVMTKESTKLLNTFR